MDNGRPAPVAMDSRRSYVIRIHRVFDHIDTHLGDPLDLDALAGVANFSRWHFHRLFHALTGETVADRVRRRRLEVAAGRLLASPEAAAFDVALDVGFTSAAVFTRAFRAYFGVTPTAWRRGAYRAWADVHKAQLSKIRQAHGTSDQALLAGFREDAELWPMGRVVPTGAAAMNVELKTLPETRVACLRHVGPYAGPGIPNAWQRLAALCEPLGLMEPRRTMFGVCHDDPDLTPPDKCRYDACIEVDASFRPAGELVLQTIAPGRYACARFAGTSAQVYDGWGRLMREWLPDSGYQVDDRLPIEVYDKDFVMDAQTGVFACALCLPVRRL